MKNFIIVSPFRLLALAIPFLLIGGGSVMAQQAASQDGKAETKKVKVVKVINGETTVEEYDASDLDAGLIWIQSDEENGDAKVEERVTRLDGDHAKCEKLIKIELDSEGSEFPHLLKFNEDMEGVTGGEGKRMVLITEEVEGPGEPGAKMRVRTIQVVNGDTVMDRVSEEQGEDLIWQGDPEGEDGPHIMVMKMKCDGEATSEDVDVKVTSDGKHAYKYEMIVVRSCNSVKVEEPQAADLEKLGDESQGANNLDLKKLEAFPNPNEGRFTVRFSLKDKSTPAQMSIFNLEGAEIYQENFSGSKSYEKQVDLGDVPAGVYLLRIQQGEESMTRRLVIE